MKSAENLMFKRMKARNEERKKAKNYFLAAFLDLFRHFSHWRALFWVSWTVTHSILMILGIVRKAKILNFPVNVSTAQRGQTQRCSTQSVTGVWRGCSWYSIGNHTWKKKYNLICATAWKNSVPLCHSGTDIYLLAHTLLSIKYLSVHLIVTLMD